MRLGAIPRGFESLSLRHIAALSATPSRKGILAACVFMGRESMEYITIYDTEVLHVNRSKKANEEDSLVYRDNNGVRHTIDFATCASNFKIEHPESSGKCIGNTNICENYFLLYTSGVKTRVVFRRRFVFNTFWRYHLLSGSKRTRFLQLQRIIQCESKYTTYDFT